MHVSSMSPLVREQSAGVGPREAGKYQLPETGAMASWCLSLTLVIGVSEGATDTHSYCSHTPLALTARVGLGGEAKLSLGINTSTRPLKSEDRLATKVKSP